MATYILEYEQLYTYNETIGWTDNEFKGIYLALALGIKDQINSNQLITLH